MENRFISQLFEKHQNCVECPSVEKTQKFLDNILGILYPTLSSKKFSREAEFELHLEKVKISLKQLISQTICETKTSEGQIADDFFEKLPKLYKKINKDVEAMFSGDPAAKSHEEIILTYPGFYAIAAYRIAHILLNQKIDLLPRLITELAKSKTGIDIHPGAKIDDYFCIDHGTGVVIGETTHIGKNVKIYQGVTLGALSVDKEDADIKRHPTIEDGVVIYAGATILGGKTTIGKNSIIGGNVWITKSLPENSKIYFDATGSQKMY